MISQKIFKTTENKMVTHLRHRRQFPLSLEMNSFSVEYILWLLRAEKFWSAWVSETEHYSHSFDLYSPPPHLGILKQMKEGIILA